ncbi:MAG TPA: Uma2 family endonuclease [Myxococcota bacterium]|nr:Uma2 family endonuclease [Myxococcota bacterium]HND29664.1 Uma2 family endonuclease [Myxococcota bacterium]
MHALHMPQPAQSVVYPDSDGMPMAENTVQYEWIVTIKGGLDAKLPDFVAGDLLWYPVEGHPEIRVAPDVLVALGRPKGDRGSYRQWVEGGVAPQVVFEILSPGNNLPEMLKKFSFYQFYGVNEYYIYNPDTNQVLGYQQVGGKLEEIKEMDGWCSPALGIRFQKGPEKLLLFHKDGSPFLSFTELSQQAEALTQQAEALTQQAEEQQSRAEAAEAKAAALEARLRALGIEP